MGKGSGGGGGGVQQAVNPSAEALANIAKQVFSETTPLRQDLTDQFTQLSASGDFFNPITDQSITQSPLFDVLKLNNERAFDSARDRVLETLPTGGSLNQGLTDVELGRATNFTRGTGALAQAEIQRQNLLRGEALQLVSGGTAGALSGLSGAGNLLAQGAQGDAAFASADANRSAGKSQGVGTLAGLAISGGKGK